MDVTVIACLLLASQITRCNMLLLIQLPEALNKPASNIPQIWKAEELHTYYGFCYSWMLAPRVSSRESSFHLQAFHSYALSTKTFPSSITLFSLLWLLCLQSTNVQMWKCDFTGILRALCLIPKNAVIVLCIPKWCWILLRSWKIIQ